MKAHSYGFHLLPAMFFSSTKFLVCASVAEVLSQVVLQLLFSVDPT